MFIFKANAGIKQANGTINGRSIVGKGDEKIKLAGVNEVVIYTFEIEVKKLTMSRMRYLC